MQFEWLVQVLKMADFRHTHYRSNYWIVFIIAYDKLQSGNISCCPGLTGVFKDMREKKFSKNLLERVHKHLGLKLFSGII